MFHSTACVLQTGKRVFKYWCVFIQFFSLTYFTSLSILIKHNHKRNAIQILLIKMYFKMLVGLHFQTFTEVYCNAPSKDF